MSSYKSYFKIEDAEYMKKSTEEIVKSAVIMARESFEVSLNFKFFVSFTLYSSFSFPSSLPFYLLVFAEEFFCFNRQAVLMNQQWILRKKVQLKQRHVLCYIC